MPAWSSALANEFYLEVLKDGSIMDNFNEYDMFLITFFFFFNFFFRCVVVVEIVLLLIWFTSLSALVCLFAWNEIGY